MLDNHHYGPTGLELLTPGTPTNAAHTGADTQAALADWGFTGDELERLRKEGVVGD
jgi:hypothetical protein